jgi:hypothetical protein
MIAGCIEARGQEQLKRESLSVSELLLDLRRRKPQVTLVIQRFRL